MERNKTLSREELEQLWVTYQLNVAALRNALGPLYNAAFQGRRGHTFVPGAQPRELGFAAVMGATPDQPNGVPDAFDAATQGSSSARVVSVASATTILILLDNVVQEFARALGLPTGDDVKAGSDIAASDPNAPPVKASTLIWAGANNVRHVDEWAVNAAAFANPQTAQERWLRNIQNRSMEPLAGVFGLELPITENLAFEVFQLLTACNDDESQGTYDRVELHALQIGRYLIERAGLAGANIGVVLTGKKYVSDMTKEERASMVITDGPARIASSQVIQRVRNINPANGEGAK